MAKKPKISTAKEQSPRLIQTNPPQKPLNRPQRQSKAASPNQRREYGQQMEQLARRYLESQGLSFREANYHCKMGEIDLIMIDGDSLVFVEVRFRTNADYCPPLESITRAKQRKVIKAASHYLLSRFNSHDIACRFDAVGITQSHCSEPKIEWIKNAFY